MNLKCISISSSLSDVEAVVLEADGSFTAVSRAKQPWATALADVGSYPPNS